VVIAGVVAGGALVLAGAIEAAPTSIIGTWSGYLTPAAGSHASRQRFTVVVDRGERAGTWRISARCSGTLRLDNISNGFHHYHRVAGAHPGCAPLGVDCLKRDGSRIVDWFVSTSGTANSNGGFSRTGAVKSPGSTKSSSW
jgi:hypothetical protein